MQDLARAELPADVRRKPQLEPLGYEWHVVWKMDQLAHADMTTDTEGVDSQLRQVHGINES